MKMEYDDKSNENERLLGPKSGSHVQYDSVNQNIKDTADGSTVVPTTIETRSYWYRWYICLIYALMGMLQGAVWNTWSPIDESAECALDISSREIDQLTNWGPIVFLIAMPFFMWSLDHYGLRIPVLSTAFLVAAGTGLRCLPLPVNILKYFIHGGQILNGAAGCVVMAAPTQLSNVWFPPSERVTATSISTLLNYMGTGVGYIVGPLIVHQPNNHSHNGSAFHVSNSNCDDHHQNELMRKEIRTLMYLEFAIAAAIFLCMLGFFPDKPPVPPSASASVERMDLKEGLLALRHQKTFIIVTVTFSLTIGSYGGWTGVMSVIMRPLGVSQNEASRLGFIMTLVGCAIGLFVGWFADRIKGKMKVMILVLFIVAFFAYLYYITITQKWFHVRGLEFSQAGFWTVCIIIGIAMNAVVPLAMEMGTDAAYPTREAVATSIIVWCLNVFNFILILVLQVSDPTFANYLMLSFIGISIPLLLFFANEPMNRLQVDMHVNSDQTKLGETDSRGIHSSMSEEAGLVF